VFFFTWFLCFCWFVNISPSLSFSLSLTFHNYFRGCGWMCSRQR
jgi:hypothetical protein